MAGRIPGWMGRQLNEWVDGGWMDGWIGNE